MRSFAYRVVDVFTDVPLAGNQLAVFLDAAGLAEGEMQDVARELNLAETTFVTPPQGASDALATVRIFTPEREMPFAGHPTIGTAFALARAGRVPAGITRFTLDERIGPVPVTLDSRDPFFAWLRTPPIVFGETIERAAAAAAITLAPDDLLGSHPAQIVGAGNPFLYVPLRDAATVDRAMLDVGALQRTAPATMATGVFVFAPAPGGVYARMFAPLSGVPEDPATGSATGPLAAYMHARGLLERRDGLRFVSEQGVRMKRRSFLHVRLSCAPDGSLLGVDVGGNAVAVAEATMALPESG